MMIRMMVTAIAPFFALLKAATQHRGLWNKINKEFYDGAKDNAQCLSQIVSFFVLSLRGPGNVFAGSQGILECFRFCDIDRVTV